MRRPYKAGDIVEMLVGEPIGACFYAGNLCRLETGSSSTRLRVGHWLGNFKGLTECAVDSVGRVVNAPPGQGRANVSTGCAWQPNGVWMVGDINGEASINGLPYRFRLVRAVKERADAAYAGLVDL